MELDGLERWHFELTEKACNELLDLVLQGKKRATSSSLASFRAEGTAVPKEGELSVITDWDGHPCCVIRTTKVRVIPYQDLPFGLARLEGEDDTLASWRKNHEAFFREEGKSLGYSFSENMEVVFEEFEVVETIEPK